METDFRKVKALLMSGGGLRSYGWDVASFVNENRIRSALFVPYAMVIGEDCRSHAEAYVPWKPFVTGAGIEEFNSIHETQFASDIPGALDNYDALIVTGGNTFMLLDELQQRGLVPEIRNRVLDGSLAYMGISAGSGVACQTIQGTNDDPIVNPREGFEGIGIVPFNIKPHYFEPKPGQGEPQAVRIGRYLSANENPQRVVALPERTSLLVERNKATYLGGPTEGNAWVFAKGVEPRSFARNSDLSFLLQ